MKISRKDEYIVELQHILKYIASDKINASRQFKQKLDKQIIDIPNFPYKHRKSIYFDDDNVRDMIVMGYTIKGASNNRFEYKHNIYH